MIEVVVREKAATDVQNTNILSNYNNMPIMFISKSRSYRTADDSFFRDTASCKVDDVFMEEVYEKYPKFRLEMERMIAGSMIQSGTEYDFEKRFNEYYQDNPAISMFMLNMLLSNHFRDVNIVKAILHIVSNYKYSEIGAYFDFALLSLTNHENKGIKKFALKVFDNWDAVECLEILKGTDEIKEKWLKDYKNKIIERLERKKTDAVFCSEDKSGKLARTGR